MYNIFKFKLSILKIKAHKNVCECSVPLYLCISYNPQKVTDDFLLILINFVFKKFKISSFSEKINGEFFSKI